MNKNNKTFIFLKHIACLIIVFSILYALYIVIWNNFSLFSTCYCEGDNLSKFIFDYTRLGEGVKPAYHFKDIERIPDVTRKLKNQSGIYLWHNTLTGDTYIGSAVDLFNRTSDYGQPAYLNSSYNSRILNSLKKYPLIHWDLIIIEVIAVGDLIVRETYWISHIKPTLNILKQARSSLGYKHDDVTIKKLSEINKGENNPNFNKVHSPEARAAMSKAKSKTTYKFDLNGVLITTYANQAEAAIANGITQSTMSRRMIAVQPINGFYYTYDSNFKKPGN